MTDTEQEQAEALDPNTSPARLAELVERHWEIVRRNPAVALLIEQPDAWSALKTLAMSPRCPPALALWLLRDNSVDPEDLPNLFENGALPAEIRRESFLGPPAPWLGDAWKVLRPKLLDFLSPTEVSLLERGGMGSHFENPRPDPTLNAPELEALSRLGPVGLCLAVTHRHCPLAVLERGLADLDGACMHVLVHPALPSERLAKALASNEEWIWRSAVQNPSMTEQQLEAAFFDETKRQYVSSNPSLPARFLKALADHPDDWVWPNLARNPSLAPEGQQRLAAAESLVVRHILASNPSLSPAVQHLLATDPVKIVRRALTENPSLTDEARRRLDEVERDDG